jgi:signal transduction histidine kinase
MRVDKRPKETARPRAQELPCWLALSTILFFSPFPAPAAPANIRLVVVLYPDNNDGSPGNSLVDQSIRATFAAGSADRIEIHNEYLDVSPVRTDRFKKLQTEFLRQKYAGRTVDLVIAGLSSGLDFILAHRDGIFPGVPIVFCAVDEREVRARKLPPDVIGVPLKMDLLGTLDVALQLHPNTQRVCVIAGRAKFDADWEAEARQTFRPYEQKLEFVYLTKLRLEDLLQEVSQLPDRSLIYYLHVVQDGSGKVLVPTEVLALLAAKANAPMYGHVDSYVGRGLVGGRVFRWETEGTNAAKLGLRILAGEKPETIGIQRTSANTYLFDWRQLQRWGIRADSLPPGSVVLHREQNFWSLYRWHISGVICFCAMQSLLIVGLLVQRANRRRAEEGLRASQHELRMQTGRLLQAQETERGRIARELHDDLGQSLALLSVEMDLLGQKLSDSTVPLRGRLRDLSARIKQLSSSVHNLSHELHPSKLEQLGLVAAVRALCKEMTQAHGVPIDFAARQVPNRIPADTALCLYRIVQEALRNVIKHSSAHQASVELQQSADALCLRIVDDGNGFDPQKIPGGGGLGLVSMRERLYQVHGHIAIDSRPPGGTRIDVRVPLSGNGQPVGALPAHRAGIA